jgi:hypothetical protein
MVVSFFGISIFKSIKGCWLSKRTVRTPCAWQTREINTPHRRPGYSAYAPWLLIHPNVSDRITNVTFDMTRVYMLSDYPSNNPYTLWNLMAVSMSITVLLEVTPCSWVKCNTEAAGSTEMCMLLPNFWMLHPRWVTFNISKIWQIFIFFLMYCIKRRFHFHLTI